MMSNPDSILDAMYANCGVSDTWCRKFGASPNIRARKTVLQQIVGCDIATQGTV